MSSHDAHNPAAQSESGQPAQGELEAVYQRMDEIKREQAEEVDHNWSSMWKGDQMMDAKIKSRLSGHEEYQTLLHRARELESPDTEVDGPG